MSLNVDSQIEQIKDLGTKTIAEILNDGAQNGNWITAQSIDDNNNPKVLQASSGILVGSINTGTPKDFLNVAVIGQIADNQVSDDNGAFNLLRLSSRHNLYVQKDYADKQILNFNAFRTLGVINPQQAQTECFIEFQNEIALMTNQAQDIEIQAQNVTIINGNGVNYMLCNWTYRLMQRDMAM